MLKEIVGDLPVVSNNHRLLAKFHSGTLRIMDTMRLMSLFLNYCSNLLEFVLKVPSSFTMFLSILTYLRDATSPRTYVDRNVLLLAAMLSKCDFYFNIDWRRRGVGRGTKFTFLDAYFEIEEDEG